VGRKASVELVLDCAEPARLGAFWRQALDYRDYYTDANLAVLVPNEVSLHLFSYNAYLSRKSARIACISTSWRTTSKSRSNDWRHSELVASTRECRASGEPNGSEWRTPRKMSSASPAASNGKSLVPRRHPGSRTSPLTGCPNSSGQCNHPVHQGAWTRRFCPLVKASSQASRECAFEDRALLVGCGLLELWEVRPNRRPHRTEWCAPSHRAPRHLREER
jgi:hypothetical protein